VTFRFAVGFLVLIGSAAPSFAQDSRQFLCTYRLNLLDVPVDKSARVWIPVPPDNADQSVTIAERRLPASAAISEEPKYGNRILNFELTGERSGSITYRVTRHEIRGHSAVPSTRPADLQALLKPDSKVPVTGRFLKLVDGKTLPRDQMALAHFLYDVVDAHMAYRKDKPGFGRGDSEWACDSGFGNCTDFHSLFISLARANHLPARFEIGLPIPSKHGKGEIPGYHCWAWFYADARGWVPVDISEADKHPEMKDYYFGNLTADRVAFYVGRDITLVPKQSGPALNYFIYPYVEVDGQPWPAEKIKTSFNYEDVE